MKSVGLEYELQIVGSNTLELRDDIEAILSELPSEYQSGYPSATHDVHACCLEIRSGKHATIESATRELQKLYRECALVSDARNCSLAGGGVHPHPSSIPRRIISDLRYERLKRERGEFWANTVVFGMHVHVQPAVPLWEAFRFVRPYIPVLIAFSANSRIQGEKDTHYASTRLHLYDRIPTTGVPPELSCEQDYQTWIRQNRHLSVIEERDIYWDIRPRVRFGTIEFRLFDSPKTWDALIINATTAGALLALAEHPLTELNVLIENQTEAELLANRSHAVREGTNAEFTICGERYKASELVSELLKAATLTESFPFEAPRPQSLESLADMSIHDSIAALRAVL